jgi:hypothetical protein
MRQYVWWIRGNEYAELAALSIASVRKLDPFLAERKLIVYTDDSVIEWVDAVAGHASGVELRFVRSGRPVMVANLDAQIDALIQASRGDQLLFLDADTLLRQPFPWQPDIDLYATWREHVNGDREMAKRQPWNYGVLGAVANAASIDAFTWLRARILQMTPSSQAWYGNQLALADLLGAARAEPWSARVRWTLSDDGNPIRVMPLPCETWNFSPDSAEQDVTGKGVLHMKGSRKELMHHFAEKAA